MQPIFTIIFLLTNKVKIYLSKAHKLLPVNNSNIFIMEGFLKSAIILNHHETVRNKFLKYFTPSILLSTTITPLRHAFFNFISIMANGRFFFLEISSAEYPFW